MGYLRKINRSSFSNNEITKGHKVAKLEKIRKYEENLISLILELLCFFKFRTQSYILVLTLTFKI